MDALVMCGGNGTRLGWKGEKPLLPVGDRPMIDRVIGALAARLDTVYAVVSPNTPETAARAEMVLDTPTIQTPGEGYVSDLGLALERVGSPVMTVAADLPLLDGPTISAVLDRYTTGSLIVCVPIERKRALGVSVDATLKEKPLAPAGVNVVSDTDTDEHMITDSYRLAVNVNRPRDARIAQALEETDNGS